MTDRSAGAQFRHANNNYKGAFHEADFQSRLSRTPRAVRIAHRTNRDGGDAIQVRHR